LDATPDEEYDEYAVEALQLYQETASIPIAGVADRQTSDSLFSSTAPAADRCVLHEIAKDDKGLVVSYVQEALFTGGMTAIMPNGNYGSDEQTAIERLYEYAQEAQPSAASLFSDSSHLSKEAVTVLLDGLLEANGSGTAAEKTRIQRRLHSLYYLGKYDVDGKFGSGTQSALQNFQATNGLPETGEADDVTLSLIFSDAAIAKQLPYRVEVSIDRQSVTIYQLNESGQYDQVQQFSCSTGLGNSTPRGIFLDGYPANRWHHFKKFDCWAQYSYEIEGNIMFHSVLYSEKDTSTLREGSVYALGSPASHGCIRLSVKNAKWLFEHCKRGTVVIVIY
jgi:peptidoglycan hydrolase-like protein with peptidoglycan-binding domain